MPDASHSPAPVFVTDWDRLDDHKYIADAEICAHLLKDIAGKNGPLDEKLRAVVRAEA